MWGQLGHLDCEKAEERESVMSTRGRERERERESKKEGVGMRREKEREGEPKIEGVGERTELREEQQREECCLRSLRYTIPC